jgi:hypothetical protein
MTFKELKNMSEFNKNMKEQAYSPLIDWSKLFYLGLGLALFAKGASFISR